MSTGFVWVIVLIAVAILIGSLVPLNRHRLVLIGIVGAITLVLTAVLLHLATSAGWIVPALPLHTEPWIWMPLFALVWAGVGWRSGRVRSRVLAGLSVPVSIAMALILFNAYFFYLPTWGDVVGSPPTDRATRLQLAQVRHSGRFRHWADPIAVSLRAAPHGLVLPVTFPPTVSHFTARPGWIYLPPAWWGPERSKLPVVELFGGTPSSPVEWLRGADAQGASDAFAAANGGRAPVLVMVDDNGTFSGDTECVDRPGSMAETYAVVDVPNAVISRFGLTSDPRRWGVAGLSEGGMCALAIGLRHSDRFSVIGDFGGEPAQSVGSRAQTLQRLFGGNRALQDSYDPNVLMRGPKRPHMAVMFVSGSGDENLRTLQIQAELARRNGMHVEMVVVPGGHTYHVWGAAMVHFIPFAWDHLTGPNEVVPGASRTPGATVTPGNAPNGTGGGLRAERAVND